ncbi:MAG: hypothetical protein K2X38_00180 [Gemmataceae bacterium]|nr:hypothetical protein [Gemmataceae bacterium]
MSPSEKVQSEPVPRRKNLMEEYKRQYTGQTYEELFRAMLPLFLKETRHLASLVWEMERKVLSHRVPTDCFTAMERTRYMALVEIFMGPTDEERELMEWFAADEEARIREGEPVPFDPAD